MTQSSWDLWLVLVLVTVLGALLSVALFDGVLATRNVTTGFVSTAKVVGESVIAFILGGTFFHDVELEFGWFFLPLLSSPLVCRCDATSPFLSNRASRRRFAGYLFGLLVNGAGSAVYAFVKFADPFSLLLTAHEALLAAASSPGGLPNKGYAMF